MVLDGCIVLYIMYKLGFTCNLNCQPYVGRVMHHTVLEPRRSRRALRAPVLSQWQVKPTGVHGEKPRLPYVRVAGMMRGWG
jgi:hypothetical protein